MRRRRQNAREVYNNTMRAAGMSSGGAFASRGIMGRNNRTVSRGTKESGGAGGSGS